MLVALLVIAALLLLALFFPLFLTVGVDGGAEVRLRIFWLIRLTLWPQKPKTPAQIKKELEKAEEQPKKDLLRQLGEYKDLFGAAAKRAGKILGAVRVRKLLLHVTVAGDEPHVVAVQYGAVCALVYPFLNMVAGLMKFYPADRRHSIKIIPDYENGRSGVRLRAVLSVTPAAVLITGLPLLLDIWRAGREAAGSGSS